MAWELRSAEWKDIDFEEKLWTIPANKMNKSMVVVTDHLVPLSRQALNTARIEKINGHSKFLFPSIKGEGKFYERWHIEQSIEGDGLSWPPNGAWIQKYCINLAHENGFDHQQIELQLAHLERNKVSAAYNHATYLKQRTQDDAGLNAGPAGCAKTLGVVESDLIYQKV